MSIILLYFINLMGFLLFPCSKFQALRWNRPRYKISWLFELEFIYIFSNFCVRPLSFLFRVPTAVDVEMWNYKQQTNFLFSSIFTDEMLESENASMAERLYDLERQVLEQQEDILSLKSTLAEVLRRLNSLDCNSSRISSSTSSSSSYETTIKNNRSECADEVSLF